MPSNFLRAESGWFLFLSHSAPPVQRHFEKVLVTKNLWGHYAPLAFLAEFETAKVVGTHGAFWKWRQIIAVGLLAAILFQLVSESSATLGQTRAEASLAATAVTSTLVFHIQMRDFIAWPFMIMQLGWLVCGTTALLALIRLIHRPGESQWAWLAAGAAYASLHFLGLGVATAAATAATLIGLKFCLRRDKPFVREMTAPLLVLVAMATMHAIAMQRFMRVEPAISSEPWRSLGQFLTQALSFIPNLILSIIRGFFSELPFRPEAEQRWPYGLVILAALALLIATSLRRATANPNPRNQARFILHTFATTSFLAIITLIAIREWSEPSGNRFSDYLGAPRYVIPGSFALVGFIIELFLLLGALPFVARIILSLAITGWAVGFQNYFSANIHPTIAPQSIISHDRAWRSLVAMASECHQARLPVPDVPLGQLTQEFGDWDLKLFEPLLRSGLKFSAETNLPIVPWNDFANATPDPYRERVPSLAAVKKQLHLDTPAP